MAAPQKKMKKDANGCSTSDYRGRFPGLQCDGRTMRVTPKCCHNREDKLSGSNCCLAVSVICFLFAVTASRVSRASMGETANSQGNGKFLLRRTWLVATKSNKCSPTHMGACVNLVFLATSGFRQWLVDLGFAPMAA